MVWPWGVLMFPPPSVACGDASPRKRREALVAQGDREFPVPQPTCTLPRLRGRVRAEGAGVCAEHAQQPGGASPLSSQVEAKDDRSTRAYPRGWV